MTTKRNVYDSVKKAAEQITDQRLQMFLKELENQIPPPAQLKGKDISATTIDQWLRRAMSQARLENTPPNRAAFELWKMLEDAGANITQRDFCQIVPDPEIENRLARAIEKHYTKGKK
jgi:hypothetical protein